MKRETTRRITRALLLIAAGLALRSSSWAQLSIGLRGGIGFPSLRRTFVDRSTRATNIIGFHAGASVAYFFTSSPGIFVEWGAQLALVGGSSLDANWLTPARSIYTERLEIYTLQMPLRLGYATPLGKLSLYVSSGLQPSVALWGQIDQYASPGMKPKSLDFEGTYQRYDVAITFHTGIGFGRLPLFFGIYVDYGLLGIVRSNGEGHVGNFGVSLAYLFRRPAALTSDVSPAIRVKNINDPQ